MRVLFVLYYPGYLRYYDSVIHELADRGHEVVVAFSKEGKQDEGLEALPHPSGRVSKAPRVPRRQDTWRPLAMLLRPLTDYVRYLHPRYDEAEHLRRRHEKFLPWGLGFLRWLPTFDPRIVRALHRLLDALERAIPSSTELEEFVAEKRPDVLVVSPLLADLGHQTDLVKSAQALGVPAVLGVGSWDHLTTKGLLKAHPERTIVWNEIQRAEAGEYHYVPAERVVVTGAQPFDRWFGRAPTRDRDAFCRRVGLPAERPFVLFLGSTASISAPEAELRFVREWIAALGASEQPALREASVLVRPHPYNPGLWGEADLSDLGESVAVWPRGGANPVDEENRADYFDSMYHSAATVGINTSAMIESAIVGRPVLTVRTPEFTDTQEGTVHFHYLLPEHGGFLRVASSIEEHVRQLGEVLLDPDAASEELSRFVASFVRPQGLDRPSTPLVADAIEEAAAMEVDGDGRASPGLRGVLRATTLLLALTGENARRRRAARRELAGALSLGGATSKGRQRRRARNRPSADDGLDVASPSA